MTGILACFPSLTLTADQQAAALQIEAFLSGTDPVFLLKGYAGTGKTTLLKGICQYVKSQGREPLLMAPTGRAAKVMHDKTGFDARTIHKHIYSFTKLDTIEASDELGEETYRFLFKLYVRDDLYNQVLLVDEASMVSDAESESEFYQFGTGRLLRDLLAFGKIGQANMRTKVIFVGDPAQLPPVGMNSSPALDAKYLSETYKLTCQTAELRDVVRQAGTSGVLALATQIRHCIEAGQFNHFCVIDNGTDVRTLDWAEFMPAYQQANTRKVVVCYQNKTAKEINASIRSNRFGPNPPPLVEGDIIVVGMNSQRLGVMNGTFGQIAYVTDRMAERAYSISRKTGRVTGTLRWRWVGVRFRDDEGKLYIVETWVLENFLLADGSRLDSVENQAVYVDFVLRYGNATDRKLGYTKTLEFQESLKNDEFFNALMIKHGYAVTCHKAQGSEWKDVVVCFEHNTHAINSVQGKHSIKGLDNSAFYRWAYTAITRASGRLLALNPPRFSVFSKLVWEDTAPAVPDSEAVSAASIQTLPWGEEETAWLAQLGLSQRHESIQHKLLITKHRVGTVGVRILSCSPKPYQEHLLLEQQGRIVKLTLTYDGKFNFKHQLQGGDEPLTALLRQLMAQPETLSFERMVEPNVCIEPSISPPIAYQPPVGRPQLGILFESVLVLAAEKNIAIFGVESLLFRERYSFKRGAEESVVDFVYSGKGFLTKAGPLLRKVRDEKLLADVKDIIHRLAENESV